MPRKKPTPKRKPPDRKARTAAKRRQVRGDPLADLAVCYDFFRAEQITLAANGHGTGLAEKVAGNLWQAACVMHDANAEAAARRRKAG